MSDSIPLASTSSAASNNDWITLTQGARDKAKEYLAANKDREVVRVTFDAQGNLGLELDKLRPGDKTFAQGDVTVAVGGVAADLVKGLVVDFQSSGGKVGFSFGGTAPAATDPKVAIKARELIAAGGAGHDQHSHVSQYLNVFYSLIVLTVLELGCTWLPIGKLAVVLMLMVLAVTKAALVGAYFMHLKFEGRWKHVILVPPSLLAIILVFALMPDVSFAEHGNASTKTGASVGQAGHGIEVPAEAPAGGHGGH